MQEQRLAQHKHTHRNMLTSLPSPSVSMQSECMTYVSHGMTVFPTEYRNVDFTLAHSHTYKEK